MANHYTSILVAVDGSKEAEFALNKAIEAAKRNVGSTLSIVNIVDTKQLEAFDRSVFDVADASAKEMLANYKEIAENAGVVQVSTIAEYGAPKVSIPGIVAEEVGADLIVCGATGHTPIERFLMGSVSEAIVRTAKCDVLVIRTNKGE